jgi:cell wall-associated NlpC family hydrolase
MFAATTVVLAFLILPGRNYNVTTLQETYCKAMLAYEGTHYEWGGENARGIDCSGLVRRGLVNADIWIGIKTLNPRLVRAGLNLWWHDCSARALLQEYRGWTSPIFGKQSINAISEPEIRAGDIAVTLNGVHVLAYLGDGRWIEADPMAKKVLVVNIPCKSNGWFNVPVKIMRWRQLAL